MNGRAKTLENSCVYRIRLQPERDFVFSTGPGTSNRTARIVLKPVEFLKPSPHHARAPGKGQLDDLRAGMGRLGVVKPVLAKADGELIDGHAVVQVAKELGYATVPVIIVDHLSEAEVRALSLSLNKTAERGTWINEIL